MDKPSKKAAFKKLAKHKIHKLQNHISPKRICISIIKILKAHKCKNILIYHAQAHEYSLLKYSTLLKRSFNLYSPFMQDKSLKVVKSRLPLIKKIYGIYESKKSFANIKLDALIVPVIGVDANMQRIGHGKGYYDRFYAGLGYRPLVIFVSLHDAYTSEILCQPHDICAMYYINPYKIHIKKDYYDRNYSHCVCRTHYRRLGRVFGCQKNKRSSVFGA